MRSVPCEQSWHSFNDPQHHLLLIMDFDCPLAFRHKKVGVHLDICKGFFVLRGRDLCLLELVEIRLYLGASLCIYLFGS